MWNKTSKLIGIAFARKSVWMKWNSFPFGNLFGIIVWRKCLGQRRRLSQVLLKVYNWTKNNGERNDSNICDAVVCVCESERHTVTSLQWLRRQNGIFLTGKWGENEAFEDSMDMKRSPNPEAGSRNPSNDRYKLWNLIFSGNLTFLRFRLAFSSQFIYHLKDSRFTMKT